MPSFVESVLIATTYFGLLVLRFSLSLNAHLYNLLDSRASSLCTCIKDRSSIFKLLHRKDRNTRALSSYCETLKRCVHSHFHVTSLGSNFFWHQEERREWNPPKLSTVCFAVSAMLIPILMCLFEHFCGFVRFSFRLRVCSLFLNFHFSNVSFSIIIFLRFIFVKDLTANGHSIWADIVFICFVYFCLGLFSSIVHSSTR